MYKNIVIKTTKNKQKHGFTIIELAVIISVIVILATIITIGYGDWQKNIVITQLKSDLNGAVAAMENYRNFNNTYPSVVPDNFKPSDGTTLNSKSIDSGKGFCIDATNDSLSFSISQRKAIMPGVCPSVYLDASMPSSYSGSGADIIDLSGNENNPTLAGGVVFDNDAKALSFDGTDDWIDKLSQPIIGTGPNKFTVVGAVKPIGQFSHIVTPQSNGNDQSIRYSYDRDCLEVRVAEAINVNERLLRSPVGSMEENKWTYWAVSINDKNVKIYINGNMVSEYNETINIADWSGDWVLGQRKWVEDQFYYKGLIGMIGVYDRILSSSEIVKNFDLVRGQYDL